MASPVLITLTLTFGLNLLLYNLMILAFKADFRKVILSPPLGSINLGGVIVPIDRLISRDMAGASITKGYSPVSLCLALFDCAPHAERSMIFKSPDAGFGGQVGGYHENSAHSRIVNNCRCRSWRRSGLRPGVCGGAANGKEGNDALRDALHFPAIDEH